MVRCSRCRQDAIIRLRYANLRLCRDHLVWYFERRVRETIDKYRLLGKGERVLVAISGGKDSAACLYSLHRCAPDAELVGFNIDLGIEEGDYSTRGLEISRESCRRLGIEFISYDLRRELGATIDLISRLRLRRPICSSCGLIKRYLMNKAALEAGADRIATGHNLDDEVVFVLRNLVEGNIAQLGRLGPITPRREGLVGRIKPLYRLTEKEDYVYCECVGARFYMDECPYARGNVSLDYKEAINLIESRHPGTKLRVLRSFLKDLKPLVARPEAKLGSCRSCGMPTTAKVCAYCRLALKIEQLT